MSDIHILKGCHNWGGQSTEVPNPLLLCALLCSPQLELLAHGGGELWGAGVVRPVAHHLVVHHDQDVGQVLLVAPVLQLLPEIYE